MSPKPIKQSIIAFKMNIKKPKNILITGASSGLGAALAEKYAEPGINLFLTARNQERLEKIAQICRTKGAEVFLRALDICEQKSFADWVAVIETQNAIDLVFANAGISAGTSGKEPESATQSQMIFSTNLFGVLNTIHAILPYFYQRESGQIALISSLAGFRGLPNCPSYSASKAAVKAYGEGLRPLLKKSGINLSVITPGYIRTPMTDVNDFYMPCLIEAHQAAAYIKDQLIKNPPLISFPFPFSLAVRIMAALPKCLIDPILSHMPNKKPLSSESSLASK